MNRDGPAARQALRGDVGTTVTLTVPSFVPDLLADAAVPMKILLMLTHVVASAIVTEPVNLFEAPSSWIY